MKLRVRGNSIRLRLSPDDLTTLLSSGAVEDHVSFGGGQALRYRLESVQGAEAGAQLRDSAIIVRFPIDSVKRWARPEEVAMRAEQPLAGGMALCLLVEKDFQCLVPRSDEDDEALFPNPKAAGRGV
jgi:hypothetical protein